MPEQPYPYPGNWTRRARELPDGWPGWSDTRSIDEKDTDPKTEEPRWRIAWIRVHARWTGAIIIARRQTVDGGWAAHAAWGFGEADHGWIRWSDRTVHLAEPPDTGEPTTPPVTPAT